MSLTSIFDIAGMGMAAQSVRLNTVASNLANAESASSSIDQVYRARYPVFATVYSERMNDPMAFESFDEQAGAGVTVAGIVESDAPLERRYEPNHPQADADGYVFYPNVNPVEQMADMISASQSFQMNVEIMNSAKSMMQRILTIGQ